MDEDTSTTGETCKTSAAARELGISAEWPRAGERRGFLYAARPDRNGRRYCRREDMEHLPKRRNAWTGHGQ